MGFDVQGLRFLLGAKQHGVRFDRTATIGRQELHVDVITFHRLFRAFKTGLHFDQASSILTEANGYAEPLLRLLGGQRICSIDASAYEGASLVHDMNVPIPDHLKHSFSAVIDAGSLEHIFNFPVAIKNCMEMVEEGGHLLLMTPANNFTGHGFYQFSPELFFRLFTGTNGYEVVRAIVCEADPAAPWYEVVDPAKAGRRVELTTRRPTYLMVQARRVRLVPVLANMPQQSDYTALWKHAPDALNRSGAEVPPLHVRAFRGIVRRLTAAYRMAEPSAVAARRFRPDREVFIEVSWLT
jgi:hypothetical protein